MRLGFETSEVIEKCDFEKDTNKTTSSAPTSDPQPLPTLLEYQTSKWLDTPTTVWLCLSAACLAAIPFTGIGKSEARVISIHLWVTRSSGY